VTRGGRHDTGRRIQKALDPADDRAGAFAAYGGRRYWGREDPMSGSIALGVVLALIVAARQQAPPPAVSAMPGDPWDGRWSISETTREGQRTLVRRNATASSLAGDSRFPDRVRIVVPLPKGADYTAAADVNRVEALLVDALERDRKAIEVLVLTTDARREFVFYTADVTWAAGVVADLRPKAAPYELHCELERDEPWQLYASFAP
jgi:hypothetical protein